MMCPISEATTQTLCSFSLNPTYWQNALVKCQEMSSYCFLSLQEQNERLACIFKSIFGDLVSYEFSETPVSIANRTLSIVNSLNFPDAFEKMKSLVALNQKFQPPNPTDSACTHISKFVNIIDYFSQSNPEAEESFPLIANVVTKIIGGLNIFTLHGPEYLEAMKEKGLHCVEEVVEPGKPLMQTVWDQAINPAIEKIAMGLIVAYPLARILRRNLI